MPYESNLSQATSSTQQGPSGFSKHTTETMTMLETEFEKKKQVGEQPKVTYQQLTGQDTKRADAVKLFFEVLVLSTKDMVKVKQNKPYGDITISQVVIG